MPESQSPPDQDASARIASSFARAFEELQESISRSLGLKAATEELNAARVAIEDLCRGMLRQMEEDKEQRRVVGDQLAALAGSLERLVSHLQGLSQLMGDLLERLAQPSPALAPPPPPETPFQPGGEGVTVTLVGVPGFQALMEIQKALSSMQHVAGASVERYQEGDSRLLVHLSAPVTATDIAGRLRGSTQYAVAVEESKPEFSRLRLKIVQSPL